MCYLTNEEFLRIFSRETKKRRNSFQLLAIMFFTAFSASLLGVLYLWDTLIYEEARVFVAVFCIGSLLIACYTIYDTVIEPLNVSIEIWKRIQRLRRGREMLNSSPLFNPSIDVPQISDDTEPILNFPRSPRSGRSHPYETRQAVSSRNAPAAHNPVAVVTLFRSPRTLRPRPRTHSFSSSELDEDVTAHSAARALVVPVEVHRADESTESEN